MTTRFTAVCLLIGMAASGAAEEQIPFGFYKDVPPAVSEDGQDVRIITVHLDGQVYFRTREGYPDLRIFDGAGAEVPFLLEKATAERYDTKRTACRGKVVSLKEEDGSIEVHLRLDKNARPAAGLTLYTPLRDFERRISVHGSATGEDWEPLVSNVLVFDYSRYMDVTSREIEFPKNRHREFKVSIEDVTDEQQSSLTRLTRRISDDREIERTETTTVSRRPFRMDRIEFWSVEPVKESRGARKAEYPIIEFERSDDEEKKQTVLTLTTQREPLTEFTLVTKSRNFSRRARVEVPVERGVRTDWDEIGQATISLVEIGDFKREQLKIGFPERRSEQFRIVIENEDNPPLEITNVETEGNVYQMVFLAPETGACRVYYGSEAAELPSYDTAAVLHHPKKSFDSSFVRLGLEVANPGFGEPPGTAIRKLFGSPAFLGGAICIVVAVLTWVLFSAGRRIDAMTDGEGSE